MILVGKDATTDGSVLLAHNNDLTGQEESLIDKRPRQRHAPGEMVTFPSGLEIPQVSETFAWMVLRIAEGFKEGDAVAINEYQVAIAGGVALGRDRIKEAERVDPLVEGALTGGVRYVALQRARTARECVKIVGGMYGLYGVTYPSGFGVADPNEVWYIESGGGRTWAAVRVPDDAYWVQANGYRIGVIDPGDSVNVLTSPGLLEFCKRRGLWDPAEGPFSFKKAFGGKYRTTPGKKFYNTRRVWRGMDLLSPSLGLDPESDEFPATAVPDDKISVAMLCSVLRDHYDGTAYDGHPTNGEESGERLIASPTCVHTDVIQLRDDMPADVGAVMWAGLSHPVASVYVPFYFGVRSIPEPFTRGDEAFAVYKRLSGALFEDYTERTHAVRSMRNAFESTCRDRQETVEKTAEKLHRDDPDLARDFLTSYVTGLCERAVRQARQAIIELEGAD
jgi:dipeptidase